MDLDLVLKTPVDTKKPIPDKHTPASFFSQENE